MAFTEQLKTSQQKFLSGLKVRVEGHKFKQKKFEFGSQLHICQYVFLNLNQSSALILWHYSSAALMYFACIFFFNIVPVHSVKHV